MPPPNAWKRPFSRWSTALDDMLQNAADTLANPSAGWATRKEQAARLGETARRAIEALRACKDDADPDVRNEVRKVLKQLPLVRARGKAPEHSLESLAHACAKPDRRNVTTRDEGFQIEVKITDERMQDVFIVPDAREDGTALVRVYTKCGKPDASSAAWALRTNAELIGCAFAVENHDRFEHLILVQNFVLAKVTPEEVVAAVKQIAYYGDWLERKLSGADTF
jgi:hypothetical protein